MLAVSRETEAFLLLGRRARDVTGRELSSLSLSLSLSLQPGHRRRSSKSSKPKGKEKEKKKKSSFLQKEKKGGKPVIDAGNGIIASNAHLFLFNNKTQCAPPPAPFPSVMHFHPCRFPLSFFIQPNSPTPPPDSARRLWWFWSIKKPRTKIREGRIKT